MTDAKPWYLSLAIWSGIFSVFSGLGLAGFTLDPATGDFSGNVYEIGASASLIASGIGSIYGRARAKSRLIFSRRRA